jgi:hypothetical protein
METNNRSISLKGLWRLALAVVGVVAIIQELRKPQDERAWHGKVAGFVPYDFRIPSLDRFKQTYWNPDGPILGSKVFGVGWAANVGGLARRLGVGQHDEQPPEG